MSRLCKLAVLAFTVLSALALAVFLVGTLGLLGQDRDPLAGVFLIPLGLPWSLAIDRTPEAAWPWLTALAPFLNVLLLRAVCRLLHRRPPDTRR